MPQIGHIYRALVASPGDCVQERKIITEVIADWNAVHSLESAAVIEPVLWETHSRPALGDRPQGIINAQLVGQCDLLIGAFWTRLGTPTGKAESGTAEEIEQFRSTGRRVLLYFSFAPVVPESLDPEQYKALTEYRNRLGREGLYARYESTADFRNQLQRHLPATMIELLRAKTSVAKLLPKEPDPVAERHRNAIVFLDRFEAFLRRLDAQWIPERDSAPAGIDEGKFILSVATGELTELRSMITEDSTTLSSTLDEALKRLRALQRHSVYLDEGKSFREFWAEGDSIIKSLKLVPDVLNRVIAATRSSRPDGS